MDAKYAELNEYKSEKPELFASRSVHNIVGQDAKHAP
jgi:hypothetical protein